MADTRISELTELAGASVANDDEFVVVDKSDTTMAASGTDKKITAASLAAVPALAAAFDPAGTAAALVDDLSGVTNATTARSNIGAAPLTPSYLTLGTNSELTSERVLTAGANVTFTDGGAGSTLTIAASGGGGVVQVSTNVGGYRTFPVPGWGLGSTVSYWSVTAGDWAYLPIECAAAWSMTYLGCVVQTAGSAGSKAIMAVFSADATWQPTALVAQTAEFAIDSTGQKLPAITASGSAGRFMLGFHPQANCNLSLRSGSSPIGPRESYLATSSDAFQVMRRVAGSYSATAPSNGTDWTTSNANSYDFAFIFPHMVAA